MFILLSNLLTYESHIKSYVLDNMSYMSYVLYVLSYVLYVYHMFPRKLQIFGKFLNFQTVPISYVFVICHIFFICFSYVSHMFVICRLSSSEKKQQLNLFKFVKDPCRTSFSMTFHDQCLISMTFKAWKIKF